MRSINTIWVALLFCAACKPEVQLSTQEADVPVVTVTSVRSLQPSLKTILPGELKPWNRTQVFPRVKGYIAQVRVDRGAFVRKGDVLSQAEAQVASAEATLLERRSKQQASTRTYFRLLQTSETRGAVSPNELEVAYAAMMADSALLKASVENLHAAKAHKEAQKQLASYLVIRAPFDGTVVERNVSPGDLVGPETNNRPMFVLEDGSKLRLTVAVPENMINAIDESRQVTFTTQAEPNKTFVANFARSANSLQEVNRSMIAEFDYVNVDGLLKAGMYAEVTIPIKRNKPSLFVPKTALLHSTEGVFVLKVEDDVTRWVNVQKGHSLDSLVEIFGTVREGDRIVESAHDELRNGRAVRAM
jgi:membrane fusion protein (multidrug efflux system)